eukprot:COSAG02_NODE_3156_length_7262_cov_12.166132_5_plen_222_part_00
MADELSLVHGCGYDDRSAPSPRHATYAACGIAAHQAAGVRQSTPHGKPPAESSLSTPSATVPTTTTKQLAKLLLAVRLDRTRLDDDPVGRGLWRRAGQASPPATEEAEWRRTTRDAAARAAAQGAAMREAAAAAAAAAAAQEAAQEAAAQRAAAERTAAEEAAAKAEIRLMCQTDVSVSLLEYYRSFGPQGTSSSSNGTIVQVYSVTVHHPDRPHPSAATR